MSEGLIVLHDSRAELHDTGEGHPERSARMRPVLDAVRQANLTPQTPEELSPSTRWSDPETVAAEVAKVHCAAYLHRLKTACQEGAPFIDAVDCAICPRSFEVAIAAVACALAAAQAVVSGQARAAFCAMRPPGHHCERDRSMGFCLINNVAVAAEWLISTSKVQRVAIVDFDVHHGNGTQHIFESRRDVLYISMHQDPATLYPGTGYQWECGTPGTPGEGHTLNVPLAPGSGDSEAIKAFDEVVRPRLNSYRPQILLLSAGFDADRRDPLGGLNWTPRTYEHLTRRLAEVANEHAKGRIVSMLEGGYNLEALEEDVVSHLGALDATVGG